MFLIIDNYDSFVYNLSACVACQGEEVRVVRCDRLTVEEIRRMAPEGIILSPGPGRPGEAELSCGAVREFAGSIPILGVCLGHQVIGRVFGARVRKGERPMHGKVTPMTHCGRGLFAGLPQGFAVTRYHSLVVEENSLPDELTVDARTGDGAVMAISHRSLPVYGVQFHPEAVLTEYGERLVGNYLELCHRAERGAAG